MNIVEDVYRPKTLPEIRDDISNALERDDLSEEEREDLLDQYGVIDDMEFTPDGDLVIYRAMNVTPTWIKNAKPGMRLGIYWSHSPNTASPYDAAYQDDEVTLLISAVLPARFVCWGSIWHFHSRGENEVRLGDDERIPLRIIMIWIDGKPAHLPNWLGQTYTD